MATVPGNQIYPDVLTALRSGLPTADRYAASTQGRQGGHGRRANNPGNISREARNNQEDAARRARHLSRQERIAQSKGVAAGGGIDPNAYPGNAKKAARQMGLDTLLQILANQGHTDPAMLNNQLTDISQGTASQQNQLDEYLASMGLQGSGVGIATHGAIGAAGVNERSGAIARENALAEERKRNDLALIMQQIMNPRLARRQQEYMLKAAKYGGGSNLGAYGNILGGLGDLLKGFGGPSSHDPSKDPGTIDQTATTNYNQSGGGYYA